MVVVQHLDEVLNFEVVVLLVRLLCEVDCLLPLLSLLVVLGEEGGSLVFIQ